MILIKHYPNRKLYNTRTKQYITLDEIADLVRAGEEIQVTDNETGEDQTALTLAQIILDQEKKQRRGLPQMLLSQLIRSGGDWQSLLPRDLLSAFGENRFSEEELIRSLEKLGIPTRDDFNKLNQQLDNLAASLEAIHTKS